MLDLLQIIAALLRVFAFGILGITLVTIAYALLQWCLAGRVGQKDVWKGSSTGRESQKRDIPGHPPASSRRIFR
jgi:hypothetical protein